MNWIEMLWLLSIMKRMTLKDFVRASEEIDERLQRDDLSLPMRSFVLATRLWIKFFGFNYEAALSLAIELKGNPLADECMKAIEFFNGENRDFEARHIRWLGSSTEIYRLWLKEFPCDGDRTEIASEIRSNLNLAIVELQKIAPPVRRSYL